MYTNYLLDKDFLRQLDEYPHKEKYAKLVSLDYNENQLEEIQGKITSGSINIDGTSAVRRTCNLSLVTQEVNINNFYWNLNTKFKLYIGLKNDINPIYPEIVWFPMGVYLIVNFNESLNSNSHVISITGKDKMCLLNGDIGGTINSLSWDFGTEEYVDRTTGVVTKTKRLIKNIIRDAVQEYAKEPYGRIQVNDLDEAAVELMEYRGSKPLYMFIDMTSNTCTQVTLDDQLEMYAIDTETPIKISDEDLAYNDCIDLELNNVIHNEPTVLYMENPSIKPVLSDENPDGQHPYTIAKIVYGQTAGYRQTDLTYAGDLILSTGESITSMLDKIVQMLGEYEYFYDLDGNFVFQRKKTFINISFNNIVDNRDETYVENASQTSAVQYSFRDNNLISSIQNTPNLSNFKNDYSIWGKRIGDTGQELPVHVRYGISKKPTYYKSYNGTIYVTNDEKLSYAIDANGNIVPGTREDIEKELRAEAEQIVFGTAKRQNPNGLQEDKLAQKIDEAYTTLVQKYNYTYYDIAAEENVVVVDWRELIYQMALDYRRYYYNDDNFNYNIQENNGITLEGRWRYEKGITNYEQYYVDLEGFWRQLYCPANDYRPITLTKKKFDEANSNEYFTRIWDEEKGIFIYTDIKELEAYNSLQTYYTHGWPDSWNPEIVQSPESINFWFDFLDSDTDLSRYSTHIIGDRTKTLNDDNIKAIYFRETPTVIFFDPTKKAEIDRKTGYTYIQCPAYMEQLFHISAQGKSAMDELNINLYNHSYCTESVSLTTLPIYYLEPNARIFVFDSRTGINGEYIVSRLNLQLAHGGTMSISATKAPERLY